ncbi:Thiamine biosynthesis lipoprotein; apbE family [Cupriavidus taiwanensis]|nr:Thiamine biosynthesis lipoprotein; apbE family [Cupriavidus taiwanensis]SOZ29651.1 Thiamine biosynthesis lipoprotein; apbE family [Cupriavidus taiwanensis]SOZ46865.1 Thiamine biosynthesis lipoprotein; apbE family [Cupriavidus taiwanensis]
MHGVNRVLVPVALSAPPAPPPADARLQRWGGTTMGTSWSVAALLPPDADAGAIAADIRDVLGRVIAQMSNWEADSDLSRFNRAPAGSWHALPADCFAVLQTALQVARDSGGAYDPSAGPLVDLWGFGPAPARRAPPSPGDVQAARARCGWARIETDAAGGRARQPGGVALDFCAIAKGFAVDAVARYLCAQGLDHHLTEIGGELRGHGVKPDGMPWWVALEAPPGPGSDDAQQTLVALHGLSVATSGDYRRYFDSEGRRYAHTIDPRTGYPASHALASVTVIHPQCMLADALSTALTVLGPDAGMAHARRHGIAARFLVRTADGFLEHHSPAFAAMLA